MLAAGLAKRFSCGIYNMNNSHYRVLFTVAAAFNFLFAIVSGLFPVAFFGGLLGIAPPDDPWPWRYTAVLVGCCGLLYAYAAWRPQRGGAAVAVGLLTKIGGPCGWLISVWMGTGSVRLFPLILVGDMIWWLPFAYYLLHRWKQRQHTAMQKNRSNGNQ